MRNSFLTIILALFISPGIKGQVIEADTLGVLEFPFINYKADTLINADHLTSFFEKLRKLENGDSNQLSILHIGDSHIQADFLTREVRKAFQQRFGNAGRGLVFPLRVAGTNEPNDYRSSTNAGWTVAKINSPNRLPEPGLSGISILSTENGIYFDVTTSNHDDLDYAFDQVTLIHRKDSSQFDCRFTDSPPKFGYLMSASPMEPGEITTSVRFENPTNFVRIQAEQTEVGQNSVTVNGLVLTNSKPGIVYNSVGINGAHFNDYNNSPLFYAQLKVLMPDLVILSLGANEGANIKVTVDEVIASVISMMQRIKSVNPGTCILIATPADDYFRKKYKNPYLEAVQRALKQSAEQEHVACWDMYGISGGFGSCSEWKKAALMQKDGVHFNKQGYTLQGSLLYQALIDSYLKYVAN
ncbi:MAG: GDSL-type esterase/lipase family protein [Bacteroidales bacterium]|nr:GDSL-type esterase/lipase family protein [Bacteroidales bacterium]